jgi:hypothetical protein
MMKAESWRCLAEIATVDTPWVSLIGERWLDRDGKEVEYWRTVNADSVIVIPEMAFTLLLPEPAFRPGVGRSTLDFPGGRCPPQVSPRDAAFAILERELGIEHDLVLDIRPICSKPLLINSSFSNQCLHGFHAAISAGAAGRLHGHQAFANDEVGHKALLDELECLQCRGLLLELLRAADHGER